MSEKKDERTELRDVEVKSADGKQTTTIGDLTAGTVTFGGGEVRADGKRIN